MPSPSDAISAYIYAKDGNRPWLMRRAFAEEAALEMVVKTDAVSFPSSSTGLAAITDTLVRRFSDEFENIYTFCMASPAELSDRQLSCDWLVAMSSKVGGEIRVGCGRYDWSFQPSDQCLAERLTITIEHMRLFPPKSLDAIAGWVGGLSYPWCSVEEVTRSMPGLQGLAEIADAIPSGR